jgi:broad specificity phosphatase PhoE
MMADDAAPGLQDKSAVNYRAASGADQRCGTCRYGYGPVGDRRCYRVRGQIFPNDVCDLWEAKVDVDYGAPVGIRPRSRNPWMRAMMALHRGGGSVIVVRHGSTTHNLGGVGFDLIRGHADIPMTEGGRQEVEATARLLADQDIEVVHTSDLVRAAASARIIAAAQWDRPRIEESAALRSWDMGAAMEGLVTSPEVVAKITDWVERDTVVPPGGESFWAYCERLLAYVGPLFEEAERVGAVLAIVTHGRCVQIIDYWVAAGCDEACMRRDFAVPLAQEPDTIPPGGAVCYRYDRYGWAGQIVPTGAPSPGTEAAAGGLISARTGEAVAS